MNRACCAQETAVQLLVVPIKSEILTMVTAVLSYMERGRGFLGKIASWEGRGCSQQELQKVRDCFFMVKEGKTVHATRRFLLFLYLFIASAPESS